MNLRPRGVCSKTGHGGLTLREEWQNGGASMASLACPPFNFNKENAQDNLPKSACLGLLENSQKSPTCPRRPGALAF